MLSPTSVSETGCYAPQVFLWMMCMSVYTADRALLFRTIKMEPRRTLKREHSSRLPSKCIYFISLRLLSNLWKSIHFFKTSKAVKRLCCGVCITDIWRLLSTELHWFWHVRWTWRISPWMCRLVSCSLKAVSIPLSPRVWARGREFILCNRDGCPPGGWRWNYEQCNDLGGDSEVDTAVNEGRVGMAHPEPSGCCFSFVCRDFSFLFLFYFLFFLFCFVCLFVCLFVFLFVYKVLFSEVTFLSPGSL